MGKKKAKKINGNSRLTNSIEFIKAEATGNDFIIVDGSRSFDGLSERIIKNPSAFALRICNRRLGIGADGLVVLRSPQSLAVDYKWDFFNQDGTRAEMCGNAARCIVAYGFLQKPKAKQINIAIKKKVIIGSRKLKNQSYTISMVPPVLLTKSGTTSFKERRIKFFWIDSGVPHVVLRNCPVDRRLAAHLRESKQFGPTGTNVTFFRVIKTGIIESVTFERGVEDLTLSCGTGVIAAAWAYLNFEWSNQQVRVETPGGKLYVHFTKQQRVYLSGAANIIGVGRYFL